MNPRTRRQRRQRRHQQNAIAIVQATIARVPVPMKKSDQEILTRRLSRHRLGLVREAAREALARVT